MLQEDLHASFKRLWETPLRDMPDALPNMLSTGETLDMTNSDADTNNAAADDDDDDGEDLFDKDDAFEDILDQSRLDTEL